ncbi:DUF3422 family protein [Ferrovibrio sp.]|uniref:DUF3422 family protein n=1 Tax=Ferrovibrio sp. TaxID=1917215 RepID=UPI003D0BF258
MAGIGSSSAGAMPATIHPLRQALVDELHARPPVPLAAPARVLNFVLFGAANLTGDPLRSLALAQGAEAAETIAKHAVLALGPYVAIQERRTEFTTYTLYLPRAAGSSVEAAPDLPPALQAWIAGLPGELIAASDLVILAPGEAAPDTALLARLFDDNALVASRAVSGRADVWTDFKLRQGKTTLLIHDHGLTDAQRGRLVLRLLDIESYRMMALLALPLAQKVAPRITALEQGLGKLASRMVDVDHHESEQTLLREIAGAAAEVETLAVDTPFRFGAARAYHALVSRRIEELREERIEGLPTLGEFMERRLSPAMRTCETMAERIEGLSRRATRMANLLRTRVDVALERQNVAQLDSMNRRLKLQLRLQETVEGLSVAAITYYAVGLVGYAAQALYAMGVPVNKEIAIGVAIPVIAGTVWLGLRRLRRSLQKDGLH